MAEQLIIPTDPRFKNLSGQRFGRLTAVAYGGRVGSKGEVAFTCVCDCGVTKLVRSSTLVRGETRSCGCWRDEKLRARGRRACRTNEAEYSTWSRMISRCCNEKAKDYSYYGGRGISVCKAWLGDKGYFVFYEDMGPKPSPQHSIDRIDNNGNYEPSNCRWATHLEQMNNTRRNVYLTHNGRTLSLSQWSRELGRSRSLVHQRLKNGWSAARALEASDTD